MSYLLYSPPEPPVQRRERLQSVRTQRRTWRVTRHWEYDRSSEADESHSDNWREGTYYSCVKWMQKDDF